MRRRERRAGTRVAEPRRRVVERTTGVMFDWRDGDSETFEGVRRVVFGAFRLETVFGAFRLETARRRASRELERHRVAFRHRLVEKRVASSTPRAPNERVNTFFARRVATIVGGVNGGAR